MTASLGKLLISIHQVYFWESLPINSASQGAQNKKEREAGAWDIPFGEGVEPMSLRSLEGEEELGGCSPAPRHPSMGVSGRRGQGCLALVFLAVAV